MSVAKQLLLVAFTILFVSVIAEDTPKESAPEKRLISTFQIVRFPNDACTASATRNGTCYTSAECSDKGGTSSGSCADGFGVCCQFVINTCGSSTSENITYWDAPSTIASGSCSLTICPVNDNICQLRIDLTTFVITGPSTMTVSEATSNSAFISAASAANTGATDGSSYATNCLADRFSISSPSGTARQPEICGTNSGMHMYVEADKDCNEMQFDFSRGVATSIDDSDTSGIVTLATRDWDLTVHQYECGYINQAPIGCTQYQWGPTSGWLTSYNYINAGTTKHLADQNQRWCIRRERSYCYACFYKNAANSDFSFGGLTAVTNARTNVGAPCGHNCELSTGFGAAGDACNYDCAIIPGLFIVASAGIYDEDATPAIVRLNTLAANHLPAPPQINSGSIFGPGVGTDHLGTPGNQVTAGTADAATMCTVHEPYMMMFKSDSKEGVGTSSDLVVVTTAANNNGRGINLNYDLISCT